VEAFTTLVLGLFMQRRAGYAPQTALHMMIFSETVEQTDLDSYRETSTKLEVLLSTLLSFLFLDVMLVSRSTQSILSVLLNT
jgi:hypothetical protein